MNQSIPLKCHSALFANDITKSRSGLIHALHKRPNTVDATIISGSICGSIEKGNDTYLTKDVNLKWQGRAGLSVKRMNIVRI